MSQWEHPDYLMLRRYPGRSRRHDDLQPWHWSEFWFGLTLGLCLAVVAFELIVLPAVLR